MSDCHQVRLASGHTVTLRPMERDHSEFTAFIGMRVVGRVSRYGSYYRFHQLISGQAKLKKLPGRFTTVLAVAEAILRATR